MNATKKTLTTLAAAAALAIGGLSIAQTSGTAGGSTDATGTSTPSSSTLNNNSTMGASGSTSGTMSGSTVTPGAADTNPSGTLSRTDTGADRTAQMDRN